MKARDMIAILEKNPDLELGSVQINRWLEGDETEKRDVMLDFVKVFGEFTKKKLSDGQIYLLHVRQLDGLEVTLYRYDSCRVVGHRMAKEPVTNCDIEEGRVKQEEVVYS